MKNLSEETKTKLIYSGELIVIAIVFLVIGLLKAFGVMGYDNTRRVIFNWVTLVGGTWIVIDFFWTVFSKKRYEKQSILDKILNLPLGVFLLVFDILCLTNSSLHEEFYIAGMVSVFLYISINYIIQGIYHFYHPLPLLLEELAKDEEKEDKK